MNWHFKKFDDLTNSELYKLLKLRVDVFVVEQACPYPEIDDEDQDAIHLLVIEGNQLAAYARILIQKDHWHIGRIITHKDYRKKGLGKELMTRCITYCKEELDCTEIHLSAQTYLEQFYKDFGFVSYSSPYDWDGIMHLDMKLSL